MDININDISKKSPKVSVLMPVFNAEKYLKFAIESIINQTYINWELIIINDGSTDKSEYIIKSFSDNRIRYCKFENKGISQSLNYGLSISNGELVARMDADDISLSNRLELQVNFFLEHSEYILIGSNVDVIDENGNFLYKSNQRINNHEIKSALPSNSFHHPSVMFRKTIVLSCGGYNIFVKQHIEDLLLWNIMASYGKFYNMPETLLQYRVHPNSISNKSLSDIRVLNLWVQQYLKNNGIVDEPLQSEFNKIVKQNIGIRRKKSLYHLFVGKSYLEKRKMKRNAFFHLLKSIYFNPLNPNALFNILLLILPFRLIESWKTYRYNNNKKKLNI